MLRVATENQAYTLGSGNLSFSWLVAKVWRLGKQSRQAASIEVLPNLALHIGKQILPDRSIELLNV